MLSKTRINIELKKTLFSLCSLGHSIKKMFKKTLAFEKNNALFRILQHCVTHRLRHNQTCLWAIKALFSKKVFLKGSKGSHSKLFFKGQNSSIKSKISVQRERFSHPDAIILRFNAQWTESIRMDELENVFLKWISEHLRWLWQTGHWLFEERVVKKT